jgi:soluble lytic murein transglycosylase-like protein
MKSVLTTMAIAALLLPATLGAEIALFTDGRSLKITGYAADGETIELVLASGGRVRLPLERIERIVDDEILPQPAVAAIVDESPFPRREWRFSEERGPIFRSRYDATIVAAARRFDVDAALVSAVIKAESDFNPRVRSHKGAVGLMQLMPATAKRFGVGDSWEPTANIAGGTRYLRWLLDNFDGDVQRALAGYNAGEGNVNKYGGVPPFRETVNYVAKIARYLRTYEEREQSPLFAGG